jgi:Fic family protein
MNLKCSPPPSCTDSASSDESDENPEKMTAFENKEKESPWTRHLNLFILVFLAGVFAASGVALFTSAYLGNKSFSPTSSDSEGGHYLPDPDHLRVVEDSRYFTTQLQKPDFIKEDKEEVNDEASEAEAMKSLKVAQMLKNKGQHEKADKLFKHAFALCPSNPKLLILYGEFLMEIHQDPVEADHLFVKAMRFSDVGSDESHRALLNRQRTSVIVEEIDQKVLKSIDYKKKAFLKINRNSAALIRAKKEAYFQHIYHTVGIEGNTLNLVQTRSLLETKLAIGGKSIQEHNEVLGLDSALKYINQTLVDRDHGYITLRDILEIHRRVIGFVDPVEAGHFRSTQVYIGGHIPPPPSNLDILMDHFLNWLNNPTTLMMHPVRMAALAHYKLAYIHPFTDGNGRTSRLLMNWILMQNGFPPVIIRKEDRLAYYQHLETANQSSDIRPFVRFIAKCTGRTLDAYIWATKENSLAPFGGEDSEHVISVKETLDHLNYHDVVISGGSLGPNITITP